MTILIFILILVCLILAHEFGHFIVAKAFGIRVDEFGIFFPPRIFAIKWRGTEYSLNWLPFGGFVRIFGEDGDTEPAQKPSSPQRGEFSAKNSPTSGADAPAYISDELVSASASGTSFAKKNRWIQAAVIVAGIVFNLVLAWLLLTAGYVYGIQTPVQHEGVGVVQNAQTTIVAVLPGSPVDKAGLMSGDIVESVITGTSQLEPKATAEQIRAFIGVHQDETIGFTVTRAGKTIQALARPAEGFVEGKKVVGVELDDVGVLKLPIHLALVQGAVLGKNITMQTAQGLVGFFSTIVRGQANFSQVSGPIGITSIGSNAVKAGFIETIVLTALISINLAILNVLPIPGLDGGRLLFIIIEGITKRPISKKIAYGFTLVSFGLLILLMVVASYHDVVRLVHPTI
ncbi:site-2 protease family protein [Patescibacteria group bacterium]|nr:site-2 protease family protein [Patescibacteria group bacterium]